MTRAYRSPENLPLDLCQRRGGDDGAKCDGITELSQSLSEFLSTAFSGLWIGFIALFDVADAVMKNPPGEFPQPVGHQPDGPFVSKSRQETAEERLKMTALLLHRGLSGLRQKLAHIAVRRPREACGFLMILYYVGL
jgi:hypothetical protein